MTVSAQTLAFEYTANGVTTTFPYQCRILFVEQLKVYVNGVIQVGGYTVFNVGNQNGGDVVFSVAPADGATVLIRRISDRVRTTDFQQAPYFTQEELLDLDQDYQTMLLQEAAAEGDRAIKTPSTEPPTLPLPETADRVGKFLFFDNSGNPVVSGGVASESSAEQTFIQAGAGAVTRTSQDKMREVVSVTDFGASPTNTAAQNDVAFTAAFDYMNAAYSKITRDGFLRDSPPKGRLIVPNNNGVFEVSSSFVGEGNFDFQMHGIVKYVGASGVTVFTLGRSQTFDNPSDLEYVLNASTSVSNVIGFELINLVDCYVRTLKIRGFAEGLVCTAKDSRGFFGNRVEFGTFDSNVIDVHVRSLTNGFPNANRFEGGFFYKISNATYQQHCIKISSDGNYNGIESNIFDWCNFEEGRATIGGRIDCIPILVEVGNFNQFTNIRAENASNLALAKVATQSNIITTRAVFGSTREVISDNIQHTLVVEQDKMQRVFSSGDLARESIKLTTSARIYNPIITFNDIGVLNTNSTLSTAATTSFDLTTGGIKFLNNRAMLSFRIKTNGDRRFLLRAFAEDRTKNVKKVISCFNAAGTRLANDVAIATGTWSVNSYIKSNSTVPFVYTANSPWNSTGGYISPLDSFQSSMPFEVHPDVATIEIYFLWAGAESNNDVTLSRLELYSLEGNSSPLDSANDPASATGDRRMTAPAGRGNLMQTRTGSTTYDPPSLADGAGVTRTVSVAGSAVGDIVSVSFSQALQGIILTGWVSEPSIVSVLFQNESGGTIDLASGTLTCVARRIIS